jgi:hypothetical protein
MVYLEKAIFDPGSAFKSPEDLAAHTDITAGQKIEILRRWAYDASENSVAVEEGMPGEVSDLLRQILVVLNKLTGGVELEHIGPTKQHGISKSAISTQ